MTQIVQERIRQGAIYLDVHYSGWFDRIDVDTLDIACFRFCILGQLEGCYSKGLKRLRLNDGILPGFDGSDLLIDEELTEAWKETILRLRAERTQRALQRAA